MNNALFHRWRLSHCECHASLSPSDARGNKFLKECRRKPVCRGAPDAKKRKKNTNGGGGGEAEEGGVKKLRQSTQGPYKERSAVAKRQMQNNLHAEPDHDPSSSSFFFFSSFSSSSSSQTSSPSFLPNYHETLAPTSAALKLKRLRGGRSSVLVAAVVRSSAKKTPLAPTSPPAIPPPTVTPSPTNTPPQNCSTKQKKTKQTAHV